jgi:hypothetical protein
MKFKIFLFSLPFFVFMTQLWAVNTEHLQKEIQLLQEQTQTLQKQLLRLQNQLKQHAVQPRVKSRKVEPKKSQKKQYIPLRKNVKTSPVYVHTLSTGEDATKYYPTALIANNHIVTYIAGTPIISSPYLGDRPAFDGSDYIVNISSINRDIRLMQQRRKLYEAYNSIGYNLPKRPIIALSGKIEPIATFNRGKNGRLSGDLDLGSNELDVAVTLNDYVEAFMAIAYDSSPPTTGGQRINNSAFNLNLGFVNIGNLDQSPLYLTAGQLFAPFGRYASAMISSPLPLLLTRTKTRPLIVGYRTMDASGPFLAGYTFTSDTTKGNAGILGIDLGYGFNKGVARGEIGAGWISNIADAQGMQYTGSAPLTTFGGFASPTNGNEYIRKTGGFNLHGNLNYDRFNFNAEWVNVTSPFRTQDLSFNGKGARPQAGQLEAGVTFINFDKPASIALGYQWANETLALNIPERRLVAVYNISLWQDTVESLEFRNDRNYAKGQYANGAFAPGFTNENTKGTGRSTNTVTAQIGVYF